MHVIIRDHYYWPRMGLFIDWYYAYYPKCRRLKKSRQKFIRLLQPFLIPECLWQHIIINYKFIPADKYGFNIILVIVDRLEKRFFMFFTYKIYIAIKLAELYYIHF